MMLPPLLTMLPLTPQVSDRGAFLAEYHDDFSYSFGALIDAEVTQENLSGDVPLANNHCEDADSENHTEMERPTESDDENLPWVFSDAAIGNPLRMAGRLADRTDFSPESMAKNGPKVEVSVPETAAQRLMTQTMSDKFGQLAEQPRTLLEGGGYSQMVHDQSAKVNSGAEAIDRRTTAVSRGVDRADPLVLMQSVDSERLSRAAPTASAALLYKQLDGVMVGLLKSAPVNSRELAGTPKVARVNKGDALPLPGAAVPFAMPGGKPDLPIVSKAVKHLLNLPADSLDLPFGLTSDKAASVSTATTGGAQVTPDTPRLVAQQMAVAILQLSGRATEILLNPEELGRVRMHMSSIDGTMMLQISAERPETADLLRRHIETLAAEFRALGYTSISFSFGEERSSKSDDGRPTMFADESNEVATAADADSVLSILATGNLDLRL